MTGIIYKSISLETLKLVYDKLNEVKVNKENISLVGIHTDDLLET